MDIREKYKISDEDYKKFRYQPEILGMLEIAGFYERYCRMIAEYETNEEAYYATERQFNSYFGKNRYKNYETFASTLSQWLKKR